MCAVKARAGNPCRIYQRLAWRRGIVYSYPPRGGIVRAFIKVSELTDEQADGLTRTLRAVEGVVDAEVFAEDRVASVLYDVRVGLPELVAAIKRAGYDAQPM
jgi:copper chaperone CopZ